MLPNRSMPQSHVIPELVYPHVGEAVAWLCAAFGFTVRWTAGSHRAQLAIGDGAIVLMAADGDGRHVPEAPATTHAVMVRVENVDEHHARAAGHGATIVRPPSDFQYGERQYTVEDLAGHRWTFSQTIADVAPEAWGGSSAAS